MKLIQIALSAVVIALGITAVSVGVANLRQSAAREGYIKARCDEKMPDGTLPFLIPLPRQYQVGTDEPFSDMAVCRVITLKQS
jgi:hypothetical protein